LGKLRVLSGRQVCDILARHGFVEMRQRGSHIIMQKQFPGTTLTVPVPNHAELRIGTLQSIIRQSGIARREFEWYSIRVGTESCPPYLAWMNERTSFIIIKRTCRSPHCLCFRHPYTIY
jgi:predicted RNA binding protein YcfA (HicA-like mRNA interferase family)